MTTSPDFLRDLLAQLAEERRLIVTVEQSCARRRVEIDALMAEVEERAGLRMGSADHSDPVIAEGLGRMARKELGMPVEPMPEAGPHWSDVTPEEFFDGPDAMGAPPSPASPLSPTSYVYRVARWFHDQPDHKGLRSAMIAALTTGLDGPERVTVANNLKCAVNTAKGRGLIERVPVPGSPTFGMWRATEKFAGIVAKEDASCRG